MRSKRPLAAVLALTVAVFVGGISLAGAREAQPADDRSPRSAVDETPSPTVDDHRGSTSTIDDNSGMTTPDVVPAPDDGGQNRGPDDHGRNRGPGGADAVRADDQHESTSTTVDDNADVPGEDGGVHQCRGCDNGADDGVGHDPNDDGVHHGGGDDHGVDDHSVDDHGGDDHGGRG